MSKQSSLEERSEDLFAELFGYTDTESENGEQTAEDFTRDDLEDGGYRSVDNDTGTEEEEGDSSHSSHSWIEERTPTRKPVLNEEQVISLLLPCSSIKHTRISPYSKITASLSYDSVTRLYLLHGRSCQHTGDQSSHSCVALEALSMQWCSELLTVIDTTLKSIVTGRCLPAFLKKIAAGTLVDAECLLRHLCDVYPIDISETEEDLKLRFENQLLTKPIPFLNQPVLRYQCNLCLNWFPKIARHRYNIKKDCLAHPPGEIEDDALQRYFIMPLNPGTGEKMGLQKSLKVMLAACFVPYSTPHTTDTNPGSSLQLPENYGHISQLTVPAYVDGLRWSEQLEKAKENPLIFLEIQRLACGHRISKKEQQGGSSLLPVEEFLLSLPNFVREYLKGAEWRVSSAHCSVRGLVTASAKGAFRTLTNHTLDEYGMVVRNAIAFCLRWLFLQRHEHEKVDYFTQVGWSPKWMGNQLKISTDFLDALACLDSDHDQSDKDEDEYHNLVMEYIHRFLVSSFSTAFIDGSGIGSIVEQTIMLSSFSPTHGWQRASRIINGPLKSWQYVSRAVSIHCAILGGMSSKYERIRGKEPQHGDGLRGEHSDNSDSDNSDSDDSDSDNSDSDNGDSDDDLDGEEMMELLDFSVIGDFAKTQSTADAESQESDRIVKFFKIDADVFKARNTAYQWGRCSTIWSIMLSVSKAEGSVTKVEWSPDSRTFRFKAAYASISIKVDDFRTSVLELPESIWRLFLQLFPAGYPLALLNEIEKMETIKFHDDPDSLDSLFLREDNTTRVHPYYIALEKILQQPQAFTMHKQYQEALPKFQAVLLYGIMSCNGISMRPAQAAQLRFSASSGFPRNVYIDNAECYIGKPVAKQKFAGCPYYEAYWLLQNRIGLALLLYRLIFRPLEMVLLLQHNIESVKALDYSFGEMDFIFIKVFSRRGQKKLVRWNGKEINRSLRAAESPLRCEGRVYRHFTKAFIRKFLSPQAIQIGSHSNSQQKQKDSVLGRKEQLALSTAAHELFGLKPQPEVTTTLYKAHALQCARHLVISQYDLYGNDQQSIRDKVLHLASTRPFVYGSDRAINPSPNTTWITLGDRNLVEITAVILYGPTRPSTLEVMPFNGYPILPVAVALNTIWTAIHEWSTGSYQPSLQFTENSSRDAEKIFFKGVNNFKSTQRLGWLDFCLKVHRHATQSLQFFDHVSPPHIVPSVKLLHLDTSFQSKTYAEIPVLTRQPSYVRNLAEKGDDNDESAV